MSRRPGSSADSVAAAGLHVVDRAVVPDRRGDLDRLTADLAVLDGVQRSAAHVERGSVSLAAIRTADGHERDRLGTRPARLQYRLESEAPVDLPCIGQR